MNRRSALFATSAPGWSILVRLLVGVVVFLPEGIQKLLFPGILGGAGAWSLDARLGRGTLRSRVGS
ncbi:MAG TPA: hypothetical protein VEC10_03095 [Steroidobacteraceae bacterium]|nr:hypothetical protein [Steroidobacteraceae bacterium]